MSTNKRSYRGSSNPRLGVKFLVSSGVAGCLIGPGGVTIKELTEISEARIFVSNIDETYPGTTDRVVLVTGSQKAIDKAQSLIWDLLASSIKNKGDRGFLWSAKSSFADEYDHDDVTVVGKITVPASAGGLILGKGGSNLRSISEESEATVSLSRKEDALFTAERVLTISGTPQSCIDCTYLILTKLSEDEDAHQYLNRGVTYDAQLSLNRANNFYEGAGGPGGRHSNNGQTRNTVNNGQKEAKKEEPDDVTELSLTVADSLIGNILGRYVRNLVYYHYFVLHTYELTYILFCI